MESDQIQDPLEYNTPNSATSAEHQPDKSIQIGKQSFSVIVTREEFLETLSHIQKQDKVERLLELEETWSAILRVNDRVKENSAQGISNNSKILHLEEKMEGVQQRFQELNDKVNSVSKRCQALKQRMDKEIPIITEVENMEKTRCTQRPNAGKEFSSSALEITGICGNSVTFEHGRSVKKKNVNAKKSNPGNRKFNTNLDNPLFCCEICDKVYIVKGSLSSHMYKKHPLSSKKNHSQTVGKGSSKCPHCDKIFELATECSKHEVTCVREKECVKNIRKSKRLSSSEQRGPKIVDVHFSSISSCPFCTFWTYQPGYLKLHIKNLHPVQ